MRRFAVFWGLLFGSWMFWASALALAQATQAPVWPPPLSELVSTLDHRYNSMRSWQADFTQVYASGFATRTESGRLYLEKPGRMLWDYRDPVVKQFLVNGKKIWQYTSGDPEATVTQVRDAADLRTPLRYLLGHTDLPRELDGLSYSGLQPWQPGDAVIHGKPHAADAAGWSELWIEVTPTYAIDRLVIAGLDGSRNDIRLNQIKANGKLPPGLFVFVPPPGVRVVPGGEN